MPEHAPETHASPPPPLPVKNRSFLCFLATQGLGAFNDNVFKQLVLLLGIGYLMAGVEYQAVVQFLFALPFLLFSGLAGDISDRLSKGRLMVMCKLAEIIIALLGVGVFLLMSTTAADSGQTPISGCLPPWYFYWGHKARSLDRRNTAAFRNWYAPPISPRQPA